MGISKTDIGRTAISIIATLALWELLTRIFHIPGFILPAPSAITRYPLYLYHSWITFYEMVVGFLLAAAVGVFLAVVIVYSRIIRNMIYPQIVVLQIVPKVAIAPLLLAGIFQSQASECAAVSLQQPEGCKHPLRDRRSHRRVRRRQRRARPPDHHRQYRVADFDVVRLAVQLVDTWISTLWPRHLGRARLHAVGKVAVGIGVRWNDGSSPYSRRAKTLCAEIVPRAMYRRAGLCAPGRLMDASVTRDDVSRALEPLDAPHHYD